MFTASKFICCIFFLLCCQFDVRLCRVHKFALKSHHLPSHTSAAVSSPNNNNKAARSAMLRNATRGGVPAKFYSNHLLIGNISVGTPSQIFQVAFQLDMASSYLIGPDADLSDQGEYKKKIFNADNSSTYKAIWGDFESESHDVYGNMGSDIAMLDDDQQSRFAFGVADYVPYYVEQMPIDGEMGMAARFDYQNGVESLLQQLARKLPTNQQLLSVRVKPHEDVVHIEDIPYDSALTIGAEDRDNCAQSWHYVPLVPFKYSWRVHLAFFAVANAQKTNLNAGNNDAADDGLGVLHAETVELSKDLRMNYGPKKWVRQIAQQLGGGDFDSMANLFQIDCRHLSANLIFGLGEPENPWVWTRTSADYAIKRGSNCYLAFYAIDIGLWGFSTKFYANNCVTLDFGNNLIGFSTPLEGH